MSNNGKNPMPVKPTPEQAPRSIAFHVVLAAALFAFIQTFSLLAPILLSFLLVMLISLALNPLISRMRALTGGRKIPTGLIATGFIISVAHTELYRKRALSTVSDADLDRLAGVVLNERIADDNGENLVALRKASSNRTWPAEAMVIDQQWLESTQPTTPEPEVLLERPGTPGLGWWDWSRPKRGSKK